MTTCICYPTNGSLGGRKSQCLHCGCYHRQHNCIVVYRRRLRDLWRVTYWCVCIYCNEFISGPYSNKMDAWKTADHLTGESQ